MTQVSLRSLLAVLAVAGVGFASLTHPTREWNFIVVSLACTVLTLYTLHWVSSPTAARSFSLGFAVVGWIYFLLLWNSVEYSLASTWLLEKLYPLLNPGPDTNLTHYGIFFVGPNGFPGLTPFSNYLHIGHAICMLALSYAGGLMTSWFAKPT